MHNRRPFTISPVPKAKRMHNRRNMRNIRTTRFEQTTVHHFDILLLYSAIRTRAYLRGYTVREGERKIGGGDLHARDSRN